MFIFKLSIIIILKYIMTEYLIILILAAIVTINTIYGNQQNLFMNVIQSARLMGSALIISTLLYSLNDAVRNFNLWESVVSFWKSN